LQDIQRVGFAPLPEAPEVVADAPVIGLPQPETALLRRPDATAYQGDGVLAAIAPAELAPPSLPVRDGPISAIDPAVSGAYASVVLAESDEPSADTLAARRAAAEIEQGALAAAQTHVQTQAQVQVLAATLPVGPPNVVVHATDTAWIRVRDGDRAVIFEGILNSGDRFEIPQRTTEPLLRAGNAGALYLVVDSAAYGPLGPSGHVIKSLSLRPDDIASALPVADSVQLGLPASEAIVQRAEAVLGQ
jgi:hypothetical protein